MSYYENSYVIQFKITIFGIWPPIWRRILVPVEFTFYEFHVAIQDAMGWRHRQPYVFRGLNNAPGLEIRRPQPAAIAPLLDIDYQIMDYFKQPLDMAIYEYDSMEHIIELERFHLRALVPRPLMCIGGGRACPPDGIGGLENYQRHLTFMSDINDIGHLYCMAWLADIGGPFDPEDFHPYNVIFSHAYTRFYGEQILSQR